jgi:hypothetical protein
MLKARPAARTPARDPLASAQPWIASLSYTWMRRDATVLFVGCVALALAWARLAIGNASLLVFPDASEQTYAWWQYSVTELQSGRFPLWDPYTFGGRTHVGEGQEGVFYPAFLLLTLVAGNQAGSIAAIHLFAFGHAVLAFAGAYLLARVVGLNGLGSLVCGLIFALGSFFSGRAVAQLNIFAATAWVPVAVCGPFLIARTGQLRWALLSGVALGLSVLAGHGQPALHASLVVGIALLFVCCVQVWPAARRLELHHAGGALLIAATSALGVAAVQLLPMLEYAPLALRWVGSDEPVAASARIPFDVIAANPSLDIRVLPSALLRGDVPIPDGGMYVGVAATVCALVGTVVRSNRTRFLWAGLVVLGIGLAMGAAAPLLQLAYALPLMDKVREPVRYLLLAHLSLAVLAGLGVDYLAHKGLAWRAVAVGLVGMAAIELGLGWAASIPTRTGFSREVQQYYNTVEADSLAQFLATQPGLFRVDVTDSSLPRNYGELLRIPTVGGYRATSPVRIQRFREHLGWLPPDRGPDLLGTRFLVSAKPLEGVREVGQVGSLKVYENLRALPLTWLTDHAVTVADDEAALSALSQPRFDPVHDAIVTTLDGTPGVQLEPAASGSAQITEYLPNAVRVTTRSSGAMLLVTLQPFYPGWVASVDGRDARLLNVDYAFAGVAVPSGEHRVELDYRPLSVYLGAAVSIMTVFVTAMCVAQLWLRRG